MIRAKNIKQMATIYTGEGDPLFQFSNLVLRKCSTPTRPVIN